MDLSSIVNTSKTGTWLPIYIPGTSTVCMEFRMVGRDSDECKRAMNDVAMQTNTSGVINPSRLESDNKAVVAACINGWRDPDAPEAEKLFMDGVELACIYENKMMILDKFPFAYRQADQHIINDSNFFKPKPQKQ